MEIQCNICKKKYDLQDSPIQIFVTKEGDAQVYCCANCYEEHKHDTTS